MPNRPPSNASPSNRPAPALPRPTLAVWISSLIVLGLGVAALVVGVLDVARGVFDRLNPPPPGALPLLDPLYEGLVAVLLAGFLGWCQYGAVRYRSRGRSLVAGFAFFILGLAGCMLLDWDLTKDIEVFVLSAATLFVGASMVRWGWQLSRR
jgi:hypothetical protein